MSSPSLRQIIEEDRSGFGGLTLRLFLLLLLIIIILLNPDQRTITETEMHDWSYRNPRLESYVPPWLMYFLVVICPIVIFAVPHSNRSENDTRTALLGWSMAMLITAVVTEAIKLHFRSPRPDFFYRCFPDGRVDGFMCTGRAREVVEGRKSFPSGHSSFSFCSFGFISLWLLNQFGGLQEVKESFVAVLICITPLFLALGIAVSRCYDNHHHWQDVFAGSVLGLISTCICYYYYYGRINDLEY